MSVDQDSSPSPYSDKGCTGGSTGKLNVWCGGQKNSVVNGFNVYYPLVSSEKVGRLLIEMFILLRYSNINDTVIPRCRVILQKVNSVDRKLRQRKGNSFCIR